MAQNLEITDINLETGRYGSKSGDPIDFLGELTCLSQGHIYILNIFKLGEQNNITALGDPLT